MQDESEKGFYPLQPHESQYIQQMFMQAFAGWRHCVCQPEVTTEGLAAAYTSLTQVTQYHEQLTQYLPLAQVDALMMKAYGQLLAKEQQNQQQKSTQLVATKRSVMPR